MINTYIQRHEAFLQQIINNASIPASPIRSAINYALFPGGKRIRPVLAYLAGELIEVDPQIVDVIGAALELTHCYSLIHDDLPAMDNDDFRRGKPSCHKAFDEATAILAGDGMQALAIEILITQLSLLLNASQAIDIIQILIKASGISGMISGQSLDLSELAKKTVTVERLTEIHLLKTGRLIQACFEMVLAVRSLPRPKVTALRTYAQYLGLVFQMQDDYLDHYATKTLGKERSSDLANQKTTFATLFTQDQLEKQISTYYQVAMDCLRVFSSKAGTLIELTQELQNRSQLS